MCGRGCVRLLILAIIAPIHVLHNWSRVENVYAYITPPWFILLDDFCVLLVETFFTRNLLDHLYQVADAAELHLARRAHGQRGLFWV